MVTIDADALNNDLDEINLDILALLARGKALLDDAMPAFTEENRAAGQITYIQPPQAPQIDPNTGLVIPNPLAAVATRAPISTEQFAAISQRLTLLSQLTKMLDVAASGGKSYADKLRATGRRWRSAS